MRVSATAKYTRRSTRKTRLVTRAIIGRPVEEAASLLRFMPQGAARDVAKVLKSATANAENNSTLPAAMSAVRIAYSIKSCPVSSSRSSRSLLVKAARCCTMIDKVP